MTGLLNTVAERPNRFYTLVIAVLLAVAVLKLFQNELPDALASLTRGFLQYNELVFRK